MLSPSLQLNGRYQLTQRLGEGGFGETWEILVDGQIKVLKILVKNFPKAIELFQREAQVLSQLDHPGIPKVDAESYFSYVVDGMSKPIHGYVMEKIEGIDLEQWMKDRGEQPISQLQLLNWLTELTKILQYLHQHNFLHRDIKPANIMLKNDGTLVLIDFGGVKDAAETYLQNQLGDVTGTRIATRGYTPTEQMDGQAVAQSDFFALGRTCVYLLTGKEPSRFSSVFGKLVWKSNSLSLQSELVDFIDELMAPFPDQRPQTAQEILDKLSLIQRIIEHAIRVSSEEQPTKIENLIGYIYTPSSVPVSKRLRIGSLSSIAISALVLGLRFVGVLQPLEMKAYDIFLRLRPLEQPDERLAVITINDDDLRFQDELGFSRQGEWQSIAYDGALQKLIHTLEEYQPRAIGLDIYLDEMNEQESKELVQPLRNPEKLTTVCKVGNNPIFSLKNSGSTQLGFSNLELDRDQILRRHLLLGNFGESGTCNAFYAFSVQLANQYLSQEGISGSFTDDEYLRFDNVVLKNLTLRTNGYQKLQLIGAQILLNFRSVSTPRKIAKNLSLQDILMGDFEPTDIQDKIIFIGVDRPNEIRDRDYWQTPFGIEIPGVFIHAHMTSQLISAVLDDRPIIQTLAQPLEVLIIASIALWGSSIAIFSIHNRLKLLIHLLTLAISTLIAFILFLEGWWLPIVPYLLALVGANLTTLLATNSKPIRKLL
ncbi:MAG: CHASE2 domain-containing protein [Cyanobacteria bacterium P01_B01_bin.77]